MKDVGMRIRVETELRKQFITLCHKNNVPAAEVLRSFMHDFVKNSQTSKSSIKQTANKQTSSLATQKTR